MLRNWSGRPDSLDESDTDELDAEP